MHVLLACVFSGIVKIVAPFKRSDSGQLDGISAQYRVLYRSIVTDIETDAGQNNRTGCTSL